MRNVYLRVSPGQTICIPSNLAIASACSLIIRTVSPGTTCKETETCSEEETFAARFPLKYRETVPPVPQFENPITAVADVKNFLSIKPPFSEKPLKFECIDCINKK